MQIMFRSVLTPMSILEGMKWYILTFHYTKGRYSVSYSYLNLNKRVFDQMNNFGNFKLKEKVLNIIRKRLVQKAFYAHQWFIMRLTFYFFASNVSFLIRYHFYAANQKKVMRKI